MQNQMSFYSIVSIHSEKKSKKERVELNQASDTTHINVHTQKYFLFAVYTYKGNKTNVKRIVYPVHTHTHLSINTNCSTLQTLLS